MVECDSRAVLDEYMAAGVPPLGSTYRLTIGDLYHLEFARSAPWRRGTPTEAVAACMVAAVAAVEAAASGGSGALAPDGPAAAAAAAAGGGAPGAGAAVRQSPSLRGAPARLGMDPLGLAEAECAEQLQLWAVAALCR
jgi:hypothetical protein